jgi:hypothetical protein
MIAFVQICGQSLLSIVVISAVVLLIFAKIPVPIVIPMVIVVVTALVSVPIAHKILFSIMARRDPARSRVRRSCPIAIMPSVDSAFRIPIAADPDELGAGLAWQNANDTGSRWRADSDSDGNLSGKCLYARE